jgi:transcriptional antiterminator RfaH
MSILPAWYALQIWSRYERFVAGLLTAKGYEVFLPTYTDPKRVERILFSGYLFCRVSEGITGTIVTTSYVHRIVGGNKPVPIDDQEIQNLRQLVRPQIRSQPHKYFTAGARVRIESGPLAGVEGILASDTESKRLVISIHLLRRSVSATLDEGTCLSLISSDGRESRGAPEQRADSALRCVA